MKISWNHFQILPWVLPFEDSVNQRRIRADSNRPFKFHDQSLTFNIFRLDQDFLLSCSPTQNQFGLLWGYHATLEDINTMTDSFSHSPFVVCAISSFIPRWTEAVLATDYAFGLNDFADRQMHNPKDTSSPTFKSGSQSPSTSSRGQLHETSSLLQLLQWFIISLCLV